MYMLAREVKDLNPPADWEVFNLKLDILGGPLHAQLAVADHAMRLGDVIPLARRICDEMVDAVKRHLKVHDKRLTCKIGCSYCCRHLLPISVPEAMRLLTEISLLPPDRQSMVMKSFGESAMKIMESRPDEIGREILAMSRSDNDAAAKALCRWYHSLHLDCPFLYDGACAIYSARPLTCREFMSVNPAENCRDPNPDRGGCVAVPFSMADVMMTLTAELTGRRADTVLMALWQNWHHENRDAYDLSWPGPMICAKFFDILAVHSRQAGPCFACPLDLSGKTYRGQPDCMPEKGRQPSVQGIIPVVAVAATAPAQTPA
ncbi:MAG: YkgJ family cysteine cluster protein [Planctomycetes bacterium]|nr:YkgJ family cysteine cluster protein [Planctomycetota bacterium]